jgi:hypothetical protein
MIPIHSPSPVELDRRRLDKGDAPEGYSAVLKFDNPSGVNVCRLCDYRSECIKKQAKCRDFERTDKCSVYFVDESRLS